MPKGAESNYGTQGVKSATPYREALPDTGTCGTPEGVKTLRERFELTLEPIPGVWPSPDVRRLAILLKRLGRNYGLRCVFCRAIEPKKDVATTKEPCSSL